MRETEIQKEIIDWLKTRGFFCWRNSNMPTRNRRNLAQPLGMPDILILTQGKMIGLEVKTADGRVSPEQLQFGDELVKHGGFYFIVRSLQEVIEVLDHNSLLIPKPLVV